MGYTHKGAAEYHEERLDRCDPAHRGTIIVLQWSRHIVFLKHAYTVYNTERAEQSTPTAKDNQPGFEASIWEISGSHSRRRSCWRLLLFLLIFAFAFPTLKVCGDCIGGLWVQVDICFGG
jgi:hypothetical protein